MLRWKAAKMAQGRRNSGRERRGCSGIKKTVPYEKARCELCAASSGSRKLAKMDAYAASITKSTAEEIALMD